MDVLCRLLASMQKRSKIYVVKWKKKIQYFFGNRRNVYRIMGLFIDKHYQHRGIGRKVLKLSLEKLKEYPESGSLQITLDCHINNKNAMKFYESFGFFNTGVLCGKDYVFVRLPFLRL